MEPQSYQFQPTDTGANTRRWGPLIAVGIGLVMLVIGVGLAIAFSSRGNGGEASLNIQYDAKYTNLTIKFNNVAETTGGPDYTLQPGDYTLNITKPGYTDFATHFSIKGGQKVVINAQLRPKTAPTITDIKQLSLSGAQLVGAEYFYDNAWAVVTVNTEFETNAAVVAQFNLATNTWKTILGPSGSFLFSDVQTLPKLVQDFLIEHNHVSGE